MSTFHGCNDPDGCGFGSMCGFCRRQSMQIQTARKVPTAVGVRGP